VEEAGQERRRKGATVHTLSPCIQKSRHTKNAKPEALSLLGPGRVQKGGWYPGGMCLSRGKFTAGPMLSSRSLDAWNPFALARRAMASFNNSRCLAAWSTPPVEKR
jgi:hypothetical protein